MSEIQTPGEQRTLREQLEEKQSELDELLLELTKDVELINIQLAHMYASDSPNKEQDILRLINESTNYLDSQWSFYLDLMHVTGSWLISKPEMRQTSLHFPMVREDVFNIVQSNGFAVHIPENGDAPRMGLSFMYSDMPIMGAAAQGRITWLAHADPREVSLYYIRPEEKDSLQSTESELYDQLTYFDQLLLLHYHDPNSEFYRKTAKKQLQFLHKITDAVSNAMPSPQNGYKIECLQVETPYVYRRIVDGQSAKWQKIQAKGNENMLLSGNVDGVGVLEAADLRSDRPLRTKEQLVDPDAGICFIMQVEQSSLSSDVFGNNPVYVPYRKVDELELIVP